MKYLTKTERSLPHAPSLAERVERLLQELEKRDPLLRLARERNRRERTLRERLGDVTNG